MKYSLGFSLPDGETIQPNSSCQLQDGIFHNATPPVTKIQCQALGMSLVHEGGNGKHILLLQRCKPIVESSQDRHINPFTLLFTLEI